MSDISRRAFVATAATVAGAAALGQLAPSLSASPKPLNLLILGGTGFTGPHQVRYAVARGHKVTVFNRGKTNPGSVPAGVERLQGDRNTGDLESLKNRKWDAVIDVPSSLPKWVRDAATLLKDSAGQYVFISTISVYKDESKPHMDETGAVIEGGDPNADKVTGENYGALKTQAEKEALAAFPGRTTIIRPGLIVGDGDNSDRFTYWPARIARGGEVLAPGNPTDPVQFIDARDLAEWVIRMVEQKAFGTYNAVGPAQPLTMAEMLYGIKASTTAGAQFTWVPATFLEAQKVAPWQDMPVWIPPVAEYAGFGTLSIQRALDKGLTFRSLADTTQSTLAFHHSRPEDRKAKLRAGITAEREAEVLAAWKASLKK
ncbi:MAG TPA: NAD-dependent epimerase/dehydratase family protein [Thermoanaerobaculia bacterium]|jgi:2'-hydroxyisoflavone reductase